MPLPDGNEPRYGDANGGGKQPRQAARRPLEEDSTLTHGNDP
jgi:hypothetical protein